MNKKKLTIIFIIIAFLLCFLFHFVYDWFPNFITSIFFPVNESIFEHMKILFGSILTSTIIQKLIVKYKYEIINNIWFAGFFSAFLSIPIFLIMFLPIYYILGENLVITIIIMFITIVICGFVYYKIINKEKLNLNIFVFLFTFIVYSIFTFFTYFPLENNFFIDPTTKTYGINK